MISKKLFDDLGGLRSVYIQGDYEDSDLCLRLAEAGRSSWYLPAVSLYHLEGQSYPSEERALVSRYNAWLQTHMWGELLMEIAPDEEDGS
jgi:GT2 family glycosyltransferase